MHQDKVEIISRSVRKAFQSSEGNFFSLNKSTIPHGVPQKNDPRKKDKKFEIPGLTEIIEIDPKKKTCIAESGISFDKLLRETLKYGLVPKCVPELKGITIGGAVTGCSVESMSYKFGGFHDSCLEYEVISGTGDVITCSREKNSQLFELIHGSYGTLGILTRVKFELIPAKPFIKIIYQKHSNLNDFLKAIQEIYKKKNIDFMDGLIHSGSEFILCKGTFSDEAPFVNDYTKKPYYQSSRILPEDYIDTHGYFFRYDPDCHWIARNYGLENRIIRSLFGKFFLGSAKMIKTGRRFPFLSSTAGRPDVVVDVFIPYNNFPEFFKWYLDTFGDFFPVWIVPYRMAGSKLGHNGFYPWINPNFLKGIKDHLFIDMAIYGFRQKERGKNYYKLLEDKVKEMQGIKTLITYNYYEEETFWKIYNNNEIQKIKKKIDPKNLFRELYSKMNWHKKET